jgi:hypothetical protein
LLEKDIINKKKEWTDPELGKGEDLSVFNVTMMAYGSGGGGDGCGILEKIVKLGQC